MEKRYYTHKNFKLESGYVFPEFKICYHISKDYPQQANDLSETNRKKVIWIMHALTADSNPLEWWKDVVGKGKCLDPQEYTIVCANIPGSCYGTTCPTDINPNTGMPYLLDFPRITVRDIINSFELLRIHLGINKIDLVIGASIGGFQAIEWCVMQPDLIKKLAFIASNAQMTPWGNAFSEAQRMSMFADQTLEEQKYHISDGNVITEGGKKGMAAARSLALLSYRSYECYNLKQKETDEDVLWKHKVASYQHHQGEKLVKRFDPYSYLSILYTCDSHNTGRGRGGIQAALKLIKSKVYCVGIDSDILFPCSEQKEIASKVDFGKYYEIHSLYGHDGFLIEWKQVTALLDEILEKTKA
ncbi:MAG: homoserine O-acetyltransferase [Bacteroidales bacterium]|nr:homoserine O-acetyltransferase [Bacteroidales bacterium]